MSTSKKTLIVIAGPTASGKTAVGIRLAQLLSTEIISADSRQFYREISIGTAKPTEAELTMAPHHYVNSHNITDSFNVGDFEREGLALVNELFKAHNQVVMVGGSGLYVKAICQGFDKLPEVDPEIRERLNRLHTERGIEQLQAELLKADPQYYQQVDLSNPQRIIRALEVCQATGKPFSSFRQSSYNKRPFDILKIGLDMPREVLYNRINQRVDQMMADGLADEVRRMLPYRHLNALNTVGYSEIFDYLDGKTDLETAVSLIKQNTRRFAKRQVTWFKKEPDINWLKPDNVIGFVKEKIMSF